MKIYHGVPHKDWFNRPTAIALGNFDGVHRGHQSLILQCREIAVKKDLDLTVVTFEPHPLQILRPETKNKLLTSASQKEALMQQLKIDKVVYLPFTQQMAFMSPGEFVERILLSFQPRLVSVGFNYHFGKEGTGDGSLLQVLGEQFGFEVLIAPAVTIAGDVVSSTVIRQALKEGNVTRAKLFLGRAPSLTGKVVTGDGRGTELGIPTANLQVSGELLLPAPGVYAGHAWVDCKQYNTVINIGYKPTFGKSFSKTIEAFLLDFSGDIYGKQLDIAFVERLRGEKKFSSVDELLTQIDSDIQRALSLL